MKGGENMLKIMNPYQQQAIDNESIAFRAPCVCNSKLANQAATKVSGTGCQCSCIGSVNEAANQDAARN
jgi:hypothetical protein